MLTRAQKTQEVSAMAYKFLRAKAAFLVDYKGMNVEQVTRLRKELGQISSELRVVRNRLTQIAIKGAKASGSELVSYLRGTNAVVFTYGDPSASAKKLSEFAKEVEQLQLKVGFMDGQLLDETRIQYLATLPTVDVLRAQFLGILNGTPSKFVRLLNEIPSRFVRILKAKVDKG